MIHDALPTDEGKFKFNLEDTGLDNLRLSTAQLLLGIFVSTKEETQIYGTILPESLTSPEMKETKAYKTYIGFASGATPPKKAQKFKKPASPKLTNVPSFIERTYRKVNEMSKKKEKVDITRGKGIELLYKVALTKVAQFKEVRNKSMRDFHKNIKWICTPLQSAPSVAKINTSVTSEWKLVLKLLDDQKNESNDDKTQSYNENESNSKHEIDENEFGSESDQDKNEEDENDEEEMKNELVKTPFNDSNDEDEN
ncbi:hypothetical protein Tco_0033096 [Tanacetum coccineum]